MVMPLEGIRVLDWTIWQQGPVSTMMLGDLGADVIKLEERVGGDPGRGIMSIGGASTGDQRNYYFEANNRHKKSLTLNLKDARACEGVHKLLEGADVFLQNLAPGAAARLGWGFCEIGAGDARRIGCSASACRSRRPSG